MRILWTKTGSDGNCTVIETVDGSLFMIDCGIKLEIVNQNIGYRLHEINQCFVTHHHKDHAEYISKILGRGIDVYYPLSEIPDLPNSRFSLKGLKGNTIKLKSISVKPFPLVHTNNYEEKCEIYGFLIKENATGEVLLWATDTQYIPQKFPPCDIYGLECNYSEVNNYSDDGKSVNGIVERRRIISHQSLETLIEFLKKQDLSKCKDIYLIHISSSEYKNVTGFISTIKKNIKEEIKIHGI